MAHLKLFIFYFKTCSGMAIELADILIINSILIYFKDNSEYLLGRSDSETP